MHVGEVLRVLYLVASLPITLAVIIGLRGGEEIEIPLDALRSGLVDWIRGHCINMRDLDFSAANEEELQAISCRLIEQDLSMGQAQQIRDALPRIKNEDVRIYLEKATVSKLTVPAKCCEPPSTSWRRSSNPIDIPNLPPLRRSASRIPVMPPSIERAKSIGDIVPNKDPVAVWRSCSSNNIGTAPKPRGESTPSSRVPRPPPSQPTSNDDRDDLDDFFLYCDDD